MKEVLSLKTFTITLLTLVLFLLLILNLAFVGLLIFTNDLLMLSPNLGVQLVCHFSLSPHITFFFYYCAFLAVVTPFRLFLYLFLSLLALYFIGNNSFCCQLQIGFDFHSFAVIFISSYQRVNYKVHLS